MSERDGGAITIALAQFLRACYLDRLPDQATCDAWKELVVAARREADVMQVRAEEQRAALEEISDLAKACPVIAAVHLRAIAERALGGKP